MARPKLLPEVINMAGEIYYNSAKAAETYGTTLEYLRWLVNAKRLTRYRFPGKRQVNYFREAELAEVFKRRTKQGESEIDYGLAAHI